MSIIGRKGYGLVYKRFWKPIYNSDVRPTVTTVTARVYLIPVEVLVRCTVDRIMVHQYEGTCVGNCIVGIYKDGTVVDIPDGGALVVESASVAKAGVNQKQLITIADTVLEPGLYWLAYESDEATTIITSERSVFLVDPSHCYYDRGGGYGALTNPCPVTTRGHYLCPFMLLRVKSIYLPANP